MEEKKENQKAESSVIDEFTAKARAILDATEIGLIKIYKLKKTAEPGKIRIEAVEDHRYSRKAVSVRFKEWADGKSKIFLSFESNDLSAPPHEFCLETLHVMANGSRYGLFFSKEDAEAAYMKDLKQKYEEELEERMRAVKEIETTIRYLDTKIAKC